MIYCILGSYSRKGEYCWGCNFPGKMITCIMQKMNTFAISVPDITHTQPHSVRVCVKPVKPVTYFTEVASFIIFAKSIGEKNERI